MSGTNSIFGTINTFSVKNFINSRRKKSNPDPGEDVGRKRGDEGLEHFDTDDYTATMDISDTYASLSGSQSVRSGLNNAATHVYYIYLTESCCIEVSASQQNSTVKNILVQVRLFDSFTSSINSSDPYQFPCLLATLKSIRKIKANEELIDEYCLVEHIEQEQSITNTSADSQSLVPSGKPVNNKKIIVKSRILRPNENLFVLTHVWNQMKLDRKDGFRSAKLILTKKQPPTLPAHMNARKPTSLLKHRFSLQPRTSVASSTTTSATTSTKVSSLNNQTKTAPVEQLADKTAVQKSTGDKPQKNKISKLK